MRIFFLFLLTCSAFVALSQAKPFGETELKQMKADTAKVSLLLKIYAEQVYTDPLLAISYTEEAIVISKTLKDQLNEVKARAALGFCYYVIGNYSTALKLTHETLELAEKIQDKTGIANACNVLGNVYMRQEKIPLAIEYFSRTKEISIELGDEKKIRTILGNIGRAYLIAGETDSALNYLQQANTLYVKAKDDDPLLYHRFGDLYMQLKKPSLALEYYRGGVEFAMQKKNDRGLCFNYVSLADYYYKSGHYDSAIHYGRAAYKIAFGKFLLQQGQASVTLSDAFQKKGLNDSALTYLRSSLALKDTMFSNRDESEIQNLVFEERMRKLQKLEEDEATATRRVHNLQYAGIAAGTIIFLLLFLLLSHSTVGKEGLIKFLGILALLIVFELVNLLLHPYVGSLTGHSPLPMLIVMVIVASLLIPLHHRMEHFITTRLVEKNKRVRLAAARKTIAQLEGEVGNI